MIPLSGLLFSASSAFSFSYNFLFLHLASHAQLISFPSCILLVRHLWLYTQYVYLYPLHITHLSPFTFHSASIKWLEFHPHTYPFSSSDFSEWSLGFCRAKENSFSGILFVKLFLFAHHFYYPKWDIYYLLYILFLYRITHWLMNNTEFQLSWLQCV